MLAAAVACCEPMPKYRLERCSRRGVRASRQARFNPTRGSAYLIWDHTPRRCLAPADSRFLAPSRGEAAWKVQCKPSVYLFPETDNGQRACGTTSQINGHGCDDERKDRNSGMGLCVPPFGGRRKKMTEVYARKAIMRGRLAAKEVDFWRVLRSSMGNRSPKPTSPQQSTVWLRLRRDRTSSGVV
jgi:hypothetical protein